ncbi:MAG: phage virion morphogenesis protein [Burkholderiales bacterium]|nr:phage virion morphogenesis protein [Burkholderiales bacterium]
MDVWGKVDDAEILGALKRLISLGRNPEPAMRDIATLGESSTRLRFRTETGPDGKRWKPSLRVQLYGGKTLTKDAHLSGSVSSNHGRDFAEWGVNRVYAAIQQFGGRAGRKVGKFGPLRGAIIPARPYLGVSSDDARDILDILQRRIDGAAHAG